MTMPSNPTPEPGLGLLSLLDDLNWSRRTLATYLGVDEATVRRHTRANPPPAPKEWADKLARVRKAATIIRFTAI